MGTKVDCKSYLPGYYYSMRDLIEDSSSSSWPLYYGDKPLPNGQYYNGFLPRTTIDGYPGCGKDALKQKMLEHEAVFKNQVYELHRLYRIQRDMMEEVKRKELHRHPPSAEPSSSSSLRGSQQTPLEDARKWHMAGFPLLNPGYDRASFSGVEIVNSPISCTRGDKGQPGHFTFQNGSSPKDSELLDSRPLKVRKKLFDLQLPPDETEEDEKLSIHGHASCLGNSNRLADLNEPIEIEEAKAPLSVDFLHHSAVKEGITEGLNQSTKLTAGYLGVNEETPIRIGDGFLINSSCESKVDERGRLSHVYAAGSSKSNLSLVTLGLLHDKLPIPHSVQAMVGPIDPPRGTTHGSIYLWSQQHGLESSNISRDLSNNNTHLEPLVASHQAPQSDTFFSSRLSSSWSQYASSSSNPTQKITTLEPCLNNSAQFEEPFGGKWRVEGEQTALNRLPSSGFDYLNCGKTSHSTINTGFIQKGSCRSDSKPAVVIDLNESSSNEAVGLQDRTTVASLPWLKSKPANAAKTGSGERSHFDHASSNQFCRESEKIADLNQPCSHSTSDCEIVGKNEISETQPVKRILGFPIFSGGCASNGNSVGKERKNRLIDINLECEPEDEIAAEELTVEKKEKHTMGATSSIKDYIDLNSCISECEDEPSPPSYESNITTVVKTITLEIDLEAPIPLENEEKCNTTSKEEEAAVTEIPLQPPPQDEVLKKAAETILAISSSCPKTHSDNDVISHPPESSLAESLLWFVDAVSPCLKESEARDGLSNKMDDFEVMTLQLQETKEENYMPAPFVPELEEEEKGGNNTFQTRPRRGQSRRGRQRRDFQRDILPGLVSLTRHEVTEDLQTFGGLMRATGHQWMTGLARRNGARNGGRRRAAVADQTGSTAVTIMSPVCAPPPPPPLVQQFRGVEGGLEERRITGWGKTTRRPRRQRCASGNPATALVST